MSPLIQFYENLFKSTPSAGIILLETDTWKWLIAGIN